MRRAALLLLLLLLFLLLYAALVEVEKEIVEDRQLVVHCYVACIADLLM